MSKKTVISILSFLLIGLTTFFVIILLPKDSKILKEMEVDEKYYPRYIDIDKGKNVLKQLIHGSSGWELFGGKNFLFATHGNYVIRYNIKENKVDNIIYLMESFNKQPYAITCSQNGRYCITYNYDFQEPGYNNYFLIDFEEHNIKLICDIYDEEIANEIILQKIPTEIQNEVTKRLMFKTKKTNDCCNLESQWQIADGNKYIFENSKKQKKELDSIKYLNGCGSYYILSENKIGVIMATESNNCDLGYYKIAIVDVANDKIIQEYILNNK